MTCENGLIRRQDIAALKVADPGSSLIVRGWNHALDAVLALLPAQQAEPVAWTSRAAVMAIAEGRSAWMFPLKEGDDSAGAIPLYTRPPSTEGDVSATPAEDLPNRRAYQVGFAAGKAAGSEDPAKEMAERIEDLIAEFGDDPSAALACVSEYLQLRRHAQEVRRGAKA